MMGSAVEAMIAAATAERAEQNRSELRGSTEYEPPTDSEYPWVIR